MWNGPAPEAPCASHKPPLTFPPECSRDRDRYRLPTALQHEPAGVAPLGLLGVSARAPRLGTAARVTRRVALKRPVGSC